MVNLNKQPIILSLELSQRDGTVSMSNRDGAESAKTVHTGNRGVDTVFPTISKIAEELSISPRSIELVAVSIGPGGFTGLRTSIAIAKMISFSTGATIIPIETALVTVASSKTDKGFYYVLSGVKHDAFWLSKIHLQNKERCCSASISCVAELEKSINEADGVFADSFAPEALPTLCLNNDVPLFNSEPNAQALLRLGRELYNGGVSVDPLKVSPLYPREPEAVRMWKELHKK